MHPFSIDYITRDHNKSGSDESIGRTPSPRSSSPAPSECGSTNSDNAESIAQALLSLDRTIQCNLPSDSGEKPPHSYIALISMAILSTPDKKMLLSDIYQYIMDNFTYYNNKDKAWRNSIRHNLSLNECFVKNGRAENGKGNFWSIHPACVEDFSKGDFRRRHARRRARKSMKDVGFPGGSLSDTKYNVGYIPMTSSPIGFHPYAHSMYFQPAPRHTAHYTAPVNPVAPTTPFYSHTTQPYQSPITAEEFQGWQSKFSGHFDIMI